MTRPELQDRAVTIALLCQFAWLAWSSWGRCLSLYIDTYQSVYVVSAAARGEMPYRDFSYYFGPLSLSMLKWLTQLLGDRLEVLNVAGLALILVTLVLMHRLLREFEVGPWLRFATLSLFLNGFAFLNLHFAARLFNWVMPYNHASTHAIAWMLAALLFQLSWARRGGRGRLLGWSLCSAGITLNRFELGLLFGALGCLFLLGRRAGLPVWLTYLVPQTVLTLLVYGYFARAVGLDSLLWENILWIGHVPKAGSHQRQILGLPNGPSRIAVTFLVHLLLGFILLRGWAGRPGLPWLAMFLLAAPLAWLHPTQLLCDLQVFIVLLAAAAMRRPTARRLELLFLCGLSLLLLARIFFRLLLLSYFFYLGVVPLLTGVICLVELFRHHRLAQAYVGTVLWVSGLIAGYHSQRNFQAETLLLAQGAHGKLYTTRTATGLTVHYVVRELMRQKVAGQSVLVLPEGALINYLTDSRHPLYHATLLPHVVDTYGEAALIRQISQARPRFIVALHRITPEFDRNPFGLGYGHEIHRWIRSHYLVHMRCGPPPYVPAGYEGGGAVIYRLQEGLGERRNRL